MARIRSFPLHTQILVGLVAGALFGGGLHLLTPGNPGVAWAARNLTDPIGQLFLRLLLLLVIPLVFSSLVAGVASIGDLRKLGRVGMKSFAFTLIISAVSVLIGLGVANTIRPGERLNPELKERLRHEYSKDAALTLEKVTAGPKVTDAPLLSVVKTITPTNIFAAVSREPPDMLGLMFFALFLGLAATMTGAAALPLTALMESTSLVTARAIDLVMKLAPYAVFCLIFTMTSRFGFGLLVGLGWYVIAVLGGLALHMFGVYSLVLVLLVRVSPIAFFRRLRVVIVTAFSTASSNATLPTALRISESELGVPREINSFVLTIGATANQNGTALYEGVTVLFLAQLAGIELSLAAQLLVLYLAILGGIGTAGVPAGSIPFIVVVLGTIGVDPALIAVILGVDRLLDMCRTVLNVVGDIVAAAYVARSEGATLMPTLGPAPSFSDPGR